MAKNDLTLLQMNINSLKLHFGELKNFLAICLIDFQILGITESRRKEATSVTTRIILPGYSLEHIPTKPVEAL